MPMAQIRPPQPYRLALEAFSYIEYSTLLPYSPLLGMVPGGDGHPSLFLPGFAGSDRSTAFLRAVLRPFGHDPHGWHLGSNVGPHPHILEGMGRRLEELYRRTGRRVSLVGWSLGGTYAREVARQHPDMVRQVITMASPFRFRTGDRSHASMLYDLIGPITDPFDGHDLPEHRRPDLPVASTSIYTRTDGIVRWHLCVDCAGTERENIEVYATHTGIGYNIAAAIAIADRLAQPEGAWAPFRPPGSLRHLYPRPAAWVETRRSGYLEDEPTSWPKAG